MMKNRAWAVKRLFYILLHKLFLKCGYPQFFLATFAKFQMGSHYFTYLLIDLNLCISDGAIEPPKQILYFLAGEKDMHARLRHETILYLRKALRRSFRKNILNYFKGLPNEKLIRLDLLIEDYILKVLPSLPVVEKGGNDNTQNSENTGDDRRPDFFQHIYARLFGMVEPQ